MIRIISFGDPPDQSVDASSTINNVRYETASERLTRLARQSQQARLDDGLPLLDADGIREYLGRDRSE